MITDAEVLAVAARTGWTLVGTAPIGGLPHRVWSGFTAGGKTAFVVLHPSAVAALRESVLMRQLAMFNGECPECGAPLRTSDPVGVCGEELGRAVIKCAADCRVGGVDALTARRTRERVRGEVERLRAAEARGLGWR